MSTKRIKYFRRLPHIHLTKCPGLVACYRNFHDKVLFEAADIESMWLKRGKPDRTTDRRLTLRWHLEDDKLTSLLTSFVGANIEMSR